MSIYRGTGGASSVSGTAAVEDVLQASVDAQTAANAAADSATAASSSETSAASSATTAATSASNAATSESNAATSESNASSSATSASTSASNAATSESNAASSASAASTSASNAATSETNAATSASNAASSATNAATSATASATSASNAASSASAAATSESNAATSESNAASSAGTATTQAGIATTKAGEASTSAGTASTQAGIATTQAGIATTKASEASTSAGTATTQAGIATTKAGEAATSAGNASTSEGNAATSESNASTSATAASNSATSAATSASAASVSATAAAASAANAAQSYDSFDDRYLGTKTVAPTVDNDGNALVTGALYFHTGEGMKVWDGANWIDASAASNVSLYTYEYTATAGQTTFSGSDDNGQTMSYTASNIIVTYGGMDLDSDDYTATNGTSVVLADGAEAGKIVRVIAFTTFQVADTVSASAGGTFTGNVDFLNGVDVTGTVTADGVDCSGHIDVGNAYSLRWGDGNERITGNNTGYMSFITNNTERARIDSSGNLLVGTTTNWGKLTVSGSSGWTSNFVSTASGTQGFTRFLYNSTPIGSISGNNTSTSYNTSSDYRLKEDWQAMSGAIDRVKALNPVNFSWKVDGTRVDGFLAHELQEVVPEAATGTKDAMRTEEYEISPAVLDTDGNVVTEAVIGTREVPDYQGIDQSKLVPLLTAALQEALSRIEQLEADVTALKGV